MREKKRKELHFSVDFVFLTKVEENTYFEKKDMVGIGMIGSKGHFDNFRVQVLPPDWTVNKTDDFTPAAELTRLDVTGGWDENSRPGFLVGTSGTYGPVIELVDLGKPISSNSILEMEALLSTNGTAGFVFDQYDAENYKFVAIDAVNDRVIIGHSTSLHGIEIDASFARDFNATTSYRLKASMQGAGIDVSVNGALVTNYSFNSAMVDGDFGMISMQGTASFDSLTVRTNDRAFVAAQALYADAAPAAIATTSLREEDLLAVVNESKRRWLASGLANQAAMDAIQVEIAELNVSANEASALKLGQTIGNVITLDDNAAGWGWFVDPTLSFDEEYRRSPDGSLSALPESDAAGRMDLLTAVSHEIGHALGYEHSSAEDGHAELLDPFLSAGVRMTPTVPIAQATPEISYFDTSAGIFVNEDKKRREDGSEKPDDMLLIIDQFKADKRNALYELQDADKDENADHSSFARSDENESLGDKLKRLTGLLYGKRKH